MRLGDMFVYCPICGSGDVDIDQEFPDCLQCDNCLCLMKEEEFDHEAEERE